VSERFPHVRLIRNERREGYGASHNRAIREARGDYVLVLNEDMLMQGDAVARMVRMARRLPRLGVLGCRIDNPDGSLQHSCFREPTLRSELFEAVFPFTVAGSRSPRRSKMDEWANDDESDVDIDVGCCMQLPREVIAAVGAFDPGFFIYREEHDLCRRVRDHGLRVVFTPDARMVHFGGQTTRRMSLRMALIQVDSRMRYFRKHRGRVAAAAFRAILALAAAMRLSGWSLLYAMRGGREREAAAKLAEHAASLKRVLGLARAV
jgi:GT2 family glycosyltransferase